MAEIVREAKREAEQLRQRFSSFERTARFVIDRARVSPDRMQPSWWGYEAAIAADLSGNLQGAEAFFDGITDERVAKHAALLQVVVGHARQFIVHVNGLITRQRDVLGLPPLKSPMF